MDKIKKFVSSIDIDKRLFKCDVDGSIAHCKMLAKQKIISKNDSEKIIKGLKKLLKDSELGKVKFKVEYEDIHTAVEKLLTERIGGVAGKLHTARSRNDQVSLDLRIYLKNEIKNLQLKINNLQSALQKVAKKNLSVVMPGFTHLQHAQPVFFSDYIMAYYWMFERDKERLLDCLKRVDIMPLGSCALAGTTLPIDREYVKKLLGFKKITQNSIDAVSDRDFVLEFLFISSVLSMHLSRMAEDFIIWASEEFSYISFDEKFLTGSSIMPQKRNPDVLELIRAKAGRMYGNLVSLLMVMKGLPLSYNRDMQEDKFPLFDSCDNLGTLLDITKELVLGIRLNKKKMFLSLEKGFLLATGIANYLVKKEVPFREAHSIVKEIVKWCIKNEKNFKDLTLSDWRKYSSKFDRDIFKTVSIKEFVKLSRRPNGR